MPLAARPKRLAALKRAKVNRTLDPDWLRNLRLAVNRKMGKRCRNRFRKGLGGSTAKGSRLRRRKPPPRNLPGRLVNREKTGSPERSEKRKAGSGDERASSKSPKESRSPAVHREKIGCQA